MRTEYIEGDLLTKEDVGLVFKTRDGREYKLTAIVKETREGEHVAAFVDKDMTDILLLTRKGKDHDKPNLYNADLVSFVGPDFTEDKKLREFEFEAWIGENHSQPIHTANECIHTVEEHNRNCHDPMSKQFGYHITGILNRGRIESYFFSKECKYKFKKWKFTMKELPND